MVAVSGHLADVISDPTPLGRGGYFFVQPSVLLVDDPLITRNSTRVTVDASGLVAFSVDPTPVGNALSITLPASLVGVLTQWVVRVPDVPSISLASLVQDYSVDPATLDPVSWTPTIRDELDALDVRVTDLEQNGGGGGGGGAVSSVAGRTGVVVLTKSDVGLGSVDNTSDAAKPVSTAQATAIAAKYTKPGTGIPATDLTTAVQTSLGKADSALQSAPVTAVNTKTGNVTLTQDDVSDGTTAKQYTAADKTKLAGVAAGAGVNVNPDWNAVSGDAQILNKPTLGTASAQATSAFATAAQGTKADSAVQPTRSIAGLDLSADRTAGAVKAALSLTKSDVGLSNVDNTSDVSKPVSTAQQAALDAKYAKPGTGVPLTDLSAGVQTSLGKADSALQSAPVTSVASKTGAVTLAKTDVGLGNVDNTSDVNKPVSTAQQSALDAKVDDSQFMNGLTGIWIGTQAQYAAIGSPSSTVLYAITP